MKPIHAWAIILLLIASLVSMGGCAATYTELRYGELKVQNKMSASIFLDPVAKHQRTVFVQVRNTSDKPFDIESDVAAAIIQKGYQVVDDPGKAHYLLQANVLSVGQLDKSALENSTAAGFGGALGGAAIGGLATRSWTGAAVGGLVGVAAETISGSLVKVITYGVITDLQISERAKGAVSEQFRSNLKQGTADTTIRQETARSTAWKRYQTRITSSARSTNLKFETAYPMLRKGIVQSIAGIM